MAPVAHARRTTWLAALLLAVFAASPILDTGAPATPLASAGLVAQEAPPQLEPGWVGGPGSANYELAARWAPYKLEKLVHSTSIRPRWIEGSERFWYEWETSDGTRYMIVDPAEGTRRQIFDNDWLAAELTRITRDPYDRKHLPIRLCVCYFCGA